MVKAYLIPVFFGIIAGIMFHCLPHMPSVFWFYLGYFCCIITHVLQGLLESSCKAGF